MGHWLVGDTFFFYEIGKDDEVYEITVADLLPRETKEQASERNVVSPQSHLGKVLLASRPGRDFYWETKPLCWPAFRLSKVVRNGNEIASWNAVYEPEPDTGLTLSIPYTLADLASLNVGHCQKCGSEIDSVFNERCPRCGKLICEACGACMCQHRG